MSYKALYRTHRPTNFDEIKGQDHITTTLKNIIKSEKVSHAYLFSGPRGTGKTSAAKVFANVLNCKDLSETLIPCHRCDLCLEAKKGSSMDIIEIDAASNNGVAEIRELRDNVRYAPSNAKYKIYIIDEVHMLSKGAFNALLKTLEEPPRHAIFILATTEPHKIPVTILSRTQRFNFRRVEDSVLVAHLITVLDKEGMKYDNSAIKLIAKLANGGLRDALSIADQASSYTNGQISFEAISQVFGVVSLESQVKIINFAAEKNIEGLLSLITKFIDNGADLTRLAMSLIEIIKDFIVFKKTSQPKLLETLKENQVDEVNITIDSAYNMLDILVELITQLSRSEYPRQAFELAMLKLTKTSNSTQEIQKSPVMEDKEPIFSTQTLPKEKHEAPIKELAMPEPVAELSAPNMNIEEVPATPDPIGKVEFESAPEEMIEPESSDSLEDLFSTQELKEVVPAEEDTIINMEEIEASTQVISVDLENNSVADDIEEDITTTQEIQITNTPEVNQSATKTIDTPMANNAQEPEDLLSLFSSDTSTVEEVAPQTNSIADIINLLVQSEKQSHVHVKKTWSSMMSYAANSRYSEYVTLLDSAKLISAGRDFILVSSKDPSICSRINEVKFKRRFVELVKNVFGETKNVFAITRDQFIDVKDRYTVLAKSNSLPEPKQIMVPSLGEQEKTKAHKLGEDLFGDLFSM